MGLMDFIKKQFVDVIQWTEAEPGVLAWRFPMAGQEIRYGASLTVREAQQAVFVNEGKIADVFGPGHYTLTTQTVPLLTYLKHWHKGFESPFKSDVHFFSTRQQVDQHWGTPQPITVRDRDLGVVRLRAFGNYSYAIADPRAFHTKISGARETCTVADLDGQLRGLILQHISDAIAESGLPFLDLAANQVEFAGALHKELGPAFEAIGLRLDGITVQSVSLPEELRKLVDQRIGMAMAGPDLARFTQYQAAQTLPQAVQPAAQGGSGVAGEAVGLGAGVAMGQLLAQQLQHGLAVGAPAAPIAVRPEDVMATLERLGELQAKGVLTLQEFQDKKAELLRKLV